MSAQPAISPGLTCTDEYVVLSEHAASHVGSGSVSVLSTPSMIAFMERTSLLCVQKLLPEGYTTVGTMVNVRHLRAVPVGERVRVISRVKSVEGRKILFEVEAYRGEELVGKGEHERYIVEVSKFLEKARAAQQK